MIVEGLELFGCRHGIERHDVLEDTTVVQLELGGRHPDHLGFDVHMIWVLQDVSPPLTIGAHTIPLS
jgi:hypothetical protein